MHIQAKVLWREVYQGEKLVYLTGVDLETGGDIKVAGEFPATVPLMVPMLFDAKVKGRFFGTSVGLTVLEHSMRQDVPLVEVDKRR